MVGLGSSLICPPPAEHRVLEPSRLEHCHQLVRRHNPAVIVTRHVTRVYELLSIFEIVSLYETGINVFGETVGSSEDLTTMQSFQPR